MRQRNRRDISAVAEEDVAETQDAMGCLLRFPTQRVHQAARIRQIAAAHEAFDRAMGLAARVYGVTVTWEPQLTGRAEDLSGDLTKDRIGAVCGSHLPGTWLVAGDARRRRLVLSRAGLSALALAIALGRDARAASTGVSGRATLAAAAAAIRILSAQASAVLEIAARLAVLPTHVLHASPPPVLRGPASTVEWVVAVLAAQGVRQIMTIPTRHATRARQA